MNDTSVPQPLFRSFWAVFAGLVVTVVLSTAADAALHASGIYPPFGQPMSDGLFVLALSYRVVFGIVGCYVAARLGSNRPMLHAMILGGIGLLFSIAGAVATWDKGPEFGPKWYPIAVIATALPCAWLGGMLRKRQLRND
jgi:hypothetical protein